MTLGITRNLVSWRFQDHYVERAMDNSAYTAAHPDDTLVLAGPPRLTNADVASVNGNQTNSLLAVGMIQAIQFSQQKQTQPVMAIGSGRSFFVSGKAQGSGTIQRLFVNGRNLLRVLYHNARAADLPVNLMDDPAARRLESQFYINLDSELYLIPFGLGCLIRSKSHQAVGGFYVELTMIQSYQIGFTAGGNSIAESVQFVFDRLLPFDAEDTTAYGVPRATLDRVIGFVDDTTLNAEQEQLGAVQPTAAI